MGGRGRGRGRPPSPTPMIERMEVVKWNVADEVIVKEATGKNREVDIVERLTIFNREAIALRSNVIRNSSAKISNKCMSTAVQP